MKKLCSILSIGLILISCSKQKEIVPVKDLDDLLQKHFKAIGLEKLQNSNSIIFSFETNCEPIPRTDKILTAIFKLKKPNSISILGLLNNDTIYCNLSNGKKLLAFNKGGGLSEQKFDSTFNQINYYITQYSNFLAPLYSAQQMKDSIIFLGRMNIDGKDVYRVRTTKISSDNISFSNFYDIDPYELVVIRSISAFNTRLPHDEKNPDINPYYTYYENYKENNGFIYPSYSHMQGNLKPGMTNEFEEMFYKVTSLKLNAEISNTEFEPHKK